MKKGTISTPFRAQIFVHVQPQNKAWLKKEGKKIAGSESAYIDALICKASGVKPKAQWRRK
jgi:hypothetical protein